MATSDYKRRNERGGWGPGGPAWGMGKGLQRPEVDIYTDMARDP